jgi:hypothetical protein
MTLPAADSYAAGNNFASLKRSPRTIMAQAMRAILLASATAATLIGRRSIRRASQGPLRAVLARISDDSHRPSDEQPAQMSIALL